MKVARHFSGGNVVAHSPPVPSGTAENVTHSVNLEWFLQWGIQSSLKGLPRRTAHNPPVNWRATFISSLTERVTKFLTSRAPFLRHQRLSFS
jgi:hypothetical protein